MSGLESLTDKLAQGRYAAFLCSLFTCAKEKLDDASGGDSASLAEWWYKYLNDGASVAMPGLRRVLFYREVVRRANVRNSTVSEPLQESSSPSRSRSSQTIFSRDSKIPAMHSWSVYKNEATHQRSQFSVYLRSMKLRNLRKSQGSPRSQESPRANELSGTQ